MTSPLTEEISAPILRNMSPFDDASTHIDDLYAEAKNWLDGSAIENQAQCDALDVLDKSLLDAGNRLEALRIEEKKPLDDQVKAIQDRYNPYIQKDKGKVAIARSTLNPLRAAWKKRLAAEAAAKADKARREAEEERAKADAAIRASAGNLEARESAEEALATAKEAEKYAAKLDKKATVGTGLRTYYHAELVDLTAAIRYYWTLHKQAFADLVCDMAEKDAGEGVTIPGFRVFEEKRAL